MEFKNLIPGLVVFQRQEALEPNLQILQKQFHQRVLVLIYYGIKKLPKFIYIKKNIITC